MNTVALIPILQGAVAPFVLISGIGLLLLSMTNRFARPVDVIRLLLVELDTCPEGHRSNLMQQIRHLRRRCSLLRSAIALSVVSICCMALLTLVLFAEQLLGIGLTVLATVLFVCSLVSLGLSLVFFLEDIRLTLHSLDIEIERHH